MDLQGKRFRNDKGYPWRKTACLLHPPSYPSFSNIPLSLFRKVVIYYLVDLIHFYTFLIYIESILRIECYKFRDVLPIFLPPSIKKKQKAKLTDFFWDVI